MACFSSGQQPSPLSKRQVFAARMAKVAPRMTATEVKGILGEPDETRERPTLGSAVFRGTMWCYGVRKSGLFPTLGRVEFDPEGRVAACYGGDSHLVSLAMDEAQLASAMEEIDAPGGVLAIAEDDVVAFDAARFSVAVNGLRKLGKEQVLAVFHELLRVGPSKWEWCGDTFGMVARKGNTEGASWEAIHLYLLALFDTPADVSLPHLDPLGYPGPQALWRGFPLLILHNKALLVPTIGGISAMAEIAPITEWLSFFERHGTLRNEDLDIGPLLPATEAEVLSVLNRAGIVGKILENTLEWLREEWKSSHGTDLEVLR